MTEAVKANETALQLDPENSQEIRQEICECKEILRVYEKFKHFLIHVFLIVAPPALLQLFMTTKCFARGLGVGTHIAQMSRPHQFPIFSQLDAGVEFPACHRFMWSSRLVDIFDSPFDESQFSFVLL